MNLSQYLMGNEAFALGVKMGGWKEAVALCVNILERNGAAEHQYYDEILREVEELGMYFQIGPGLAMPHARPECGALNNGFALVILDKPVELEGGEWADIFLAFSAASAEEQNTSMICQIAELLENEERVECLRRARTSQELREILNSVGFEG